MLATTQGGFRTREERVAVSLPCRLNDDGRWIAARIHNASSRGLLAAANDPPSPGSYVELRLGRLVLVGRVVWRKGRFFGVRLQDRLSITALLEERKRGDTPAPVVQLPVADRIAAEGQRARTVEQSRYVSIIMQYATIAAMIAVAAGIVGHEVYRQLGRPAVVIEGALAGAAASSGR